MRVPTRDVIATSLVACAVLVYAIWTAVTDDPGATAVRVLAAIVLAAGFAASATAVVPAFDELLHGPRIYLAAASLVGVAALAFGLIAVVRADEAMLGALVLATVALWVMATSRHVLAAGHGSGWSHRPFGGPHPHG